MPFFSTRKKVCVLQANLVLLPEVKGYILIPYYGRKAVLSGTEIQY